MTGKAEKTVGEAPINGSDIRYSEIDIIGSSPEGSDLELSESDILSFSVKESAVDVIIILVFSSFCNYIQLY